MHSHSATSTNGGSVTLQNGWLTYTPPSGYHGLDAFTYTISDGFGGLSSAKVVIRPENPRQIPLAGHIIILHEPGTIPALRFRGTPNTVYRIQGSSTGLPGSWQTLGFFFSDDLNGTIEFIDPAATEHNRRFYQTLRQ